MGLQTDFKYLRMISGNLRNYKEVEQYKSVFSCPICGDSRKSKWKARGNVFVDSGKAFFKCYNCAKSLSFSNFLKYVDESLWSDYRRESRTDEPEYQLFTHVPKNISVKKDKYENMVPILELDIHHECRQYVEFRQIPSVRYPFLFYTDNYKNLVEEIFPGTSERYPPDKRLVLVSYNQQKEVVAIQGRSINGSKIRYSSAKSDDQKCFYGLDRMNPTKLVFVVEGPIDSLFMPNSVAVCNADLGMFPKAFPDVDSILVFDNEPENKEVNTLMTKAIEDGCKVCIWINCPFKGKDVNEMIKEGTDLKSIVKFILDNTYTGIRAKFKMSDWKKNER